MSLLTAQRGIDFVCRNALERGKQEVLIGYHGGGEPTVHWPVLTASFAYAQERGRQYGLDIAGSMATNGVLSAQQQQWIIRNLRGVNLSVDGLPQVQNRQRPTATGGPSTEDVLRTFRAFDDAGFPYGIRITVTGASCESLPGSVTHLLENAHPKHIQVEPVYVLGRARRSDLAVSPLSFVEAFQAARKIAVQAGVDFYYSAARVGVLTNRFCQSCGEGFSLTPQGLVSSCYEVPGPETEFSDQFIFGYFDEARQHYIFDDDKLARLRAHTVETTPWCRDCFCKWHCGGDCSYKSRHAFVDGEFRGRPALPRSPRR